MVPVEGLLGSESVSICLFETVAGCLLMCLQDTPEPQGAAVSTVATLS